MALSRAIRALIVAASIGGPALAAAQASPPPACPGNPDALGTARTIVIDPAEHARVGTMQYPETLPLAEKEVVLTFDDGPLPPNTDRILDALAKDCVRATFFVVGRMARAYPDAIRRIYNAGHTIGTHSENHPFNFDKLPQDRARLEIEKGIESAAAALGDRAALAAFFRIPGLGRSTISEAILAEQRIMVWSADFPADDWRRIGPAAVVARAIERLERKGKGVLLLHDIQRVTVLALPTLLRELKTRGYRIVHVVPAGPDRPKTPTSREQWVMSRARESSHAVASASAADAMLIPPSQAGAWPNAFRRSLVTPAATAQDTNPPAAWPPVTTVAVGSHGQSLPAPSLRSFGLPHPLGPVLQLHFTASDHVNATPLHALGGAQGPKTLLQH